MYLFKEKSKRALQHKNGMNEKQRKQIIAGKEGFK